MTALPSPGATFGDKYVVESQLGGGGAGVVYLATHRDLRQKVAVKVMRDSVLSTASERMIREARMALALQSEHVVRIMDVGRDEGRVYIVMEYLEGKDLATVLRERGKLPITEAVDYVLQACAGVAEAHARGIIHRDLKPGNLFLTQRADGTPLVKVLDFGISKTTEQDSQADEVERSLTGPAEMLGSPMYMSPEQIRHASDVDHRTDVWSLGVVLFRILTGGAPFDAKGGGVSGMLAAVVGDPATKLSKLLPDTPRGLEAAVMRCLEKAPFARWSSVADLAAALSPFGSDDGRAAVARLVRLRGEAVAAEEAAAGAGAGARRKRMWMVAAGGALFVAATGVATYAVMHANAPASASASASAPASPSAHSEAPSVSEGPGVAAVAATTTTAPITSASASAITTTSTTTSTSTNAAPTAGATPTRVRIINRPPPAPATTNARAAATNDRY
jgi:serine/threonine-protein kinase